MESSIAILGGSFDPPHNAHLELACNVLKSNLASKVILMPTKIQPLKPSGSNVSDLHRIEMIKLLINCAENDDIVLSLFEIESNQISYTHNTLMKLDEIEECPIKFIMGTDSFLSIEKWYKFEGILHDFPLIIGNRVGYDKETQSIAISSYKEKYKARITVLENVISDISSSNVRERIASGRDISNLVPDGIKRYIDYNGLYRR